MTNINRLPLLLLALLCALNSSLRPARADRLEGASWRADRAAAPPAGIIPLSGADGTTRVVLAGGVHALALAPGSTPPASFLYFQVDRARAAAVSGPLYLRVEYFDGSVGAPLHCEYDSATGAGISAHYRSAEDQAGGAATGSGKWGTAIFVLEKPLFAQSENLQADFRLSGSALTVRALSMSHVRPADWATVDTVEMADVKPLVKIGAGGQLIVGGFDPARLSDARPTAHQLAMAVPALKALGVTSHEGYVRWNLCEPEEGRFDWSVYDQFVTVYQHAGLKWVPFIIVGSPYSLPDWYYKKAGSQGYVCLEHHQESDVQSLWNPAMRKHVARFLKAFCDHYRSTGVIESILLGVTGNYGEAIYPASGNDWTADIHGQYHTHSGWWAGDPFAVASYRAWLRARYGNDARLRAAWASTAATLATVDPVLPAAASNDRARLDQADWYIGSMTDWARFWLQETRRNFPKGDIYLCTGGHAPPEHGSDFGEQCKMVAQVGGGVRITNESSDYAANFTLTRWVASASRQYGAYFSFEPAGDVRPWAVPARIYNATASGAKGLHYYYPNLFAAEEARAEFVKQGAFFTQRQPVTEIAVYYPETWIRLRGADFIDRARPLRDRFDYAFMSDGQIADGGLKGVKALVILRGAIAEAATWRSIRRWVEAGGVLCYATGIGPLTTPDHDDAPGAALFKPLSEGSKGAILTFAGSADSVEYRDWLCRSLLKAQALSPGTRAMLVLDSREDGLFATVVSPSEMLWLNTTDHALTKIGRPIPPHEIAPQSLRGTVFIQSEASQ